uniref:DUF148 domain-containing protein n=1 Tax=Meloidogyne hapla TaxID=6305 RepID=A0A1I8B2H2_MELHA
MPVVTRQKARKDKALEQEEETDPTITNFVNSDMDENDILDGSEMGGNELSADLTPEEEQQLLDGNNINKKKNGEENPKKKLNQATTQTSPAPINKNAQAQNRLLPQIPPQSAQNVVYPQQFPNFPVFAQQMPNFQMYPQFPSIPMGSQSTSIMPGAQQFPNLMPVYTPQVMYPQMPFNQLQNFHPQANFNAPMNQTQNFPQPSPTVAQPPINTRNDQRPTTDFMGFMHSFDRMSLSWALDKIQDLKGPEGVDQIKTFFKKFDSATEGISDVVRLKALESKISGRAERAFNTALGNSPFIYSSVRREMLRILETTDTKEICAFDELMSGVKRRENENID